MHFFPNQESLVEWLQENHPEALTADGFDDAVIGVVTRFGMDPVVLYDTDKCLAKLMEGGTSYEDAVEHFEFNTLGAWVGPYTPAFAMLVKPESACPEEESDDA